jgi:hypothetical protein
MLYGFTFPAFPLDMLIIPTPGGSSATADPGSAVRRTRGRREAGRGRVESPSLPL